MKFHLLAIALATWITQPIFANEPASVERDSLASIQFGTEIRPLFAQYCAGCHGGVMMAGDFKITERDGVMDAIEVGDADNSYLIERIESEEEDYRMPPPEHGPPLNPKDIEKIRRWIDEGATWEEHWSFETPKRTDPAPLIATHSIPESWSANRVDPFVWSKLHQRGTQPSSEATPREWFRRVSLTLIGLPPTPEEIAQFEATVERIGESAYEAAVDELLSRPEYGQHWASVWLDQVRYADSKGLGQDGPRTIWKYRDWVIDALNEDLPFDQFTIKQIAGDLLPEPSLEDLIATAAHRLTQSNEEGGTDDEEFRVAAVLDRINTLWQAWQGTTFGCVQCHDHPYDPFRHDEYYKFMAYFNNTADWDLDEEFPVVRVPLDRSDYAMAASLDRKIDAINRAIWEREWSVIEQSSAWVDLAGLSVEATQGTRTQITADKPHEFHTVGTVARNTVYTIDWEADRDVELSAVKLTFRPLDPETAARDSEWGAVLSHIQIDYKNGTDDDWTNLPIDLVISDELEPFYSPQESLNPRSRFGFGAYTRIMGDRTGVFVTQSPIAIAAGGSIRIRLAHQIFTLDAFPLVAKRVAVAINSEAGFADRIFDPEIDEDRAILAELRAERRGIRSTSVPVLRELDGRFRRPTNVFIRGLFLTKDEEVEPALPGWMVASEDQHPSNRLELAHWLVSDQNPLTARVLVNRVWARLFGQGLVETEEDFGSSGELPTHPELLDDLACRIQTEMGWSQKALIKELVLTQTFRQTAKASPEAWQNDPSNQWLARGPRFRLSAEALRDSLLFVSGLLDLNHGGPPARPPIPDGVWDPFQAGDRWRTPEVGDPNRYRRSVYTNVKRSIPYPMFATFDAPSREFCSSRRLVSNSPVQALALLNETTFVEAAEAFGQRIAEIAGGLEEQIGWAMESVVGRRPTDSEFKALADFYLSRQDSEATDRAWFDLAMLLMNLDETLNN